MVVHPNGPGTMGTGLFHLKNKVMLSAFQLNCERIELRLQANEGVEHGRGSRAILEREEAAMGEQIE